MSSLRRRIKNLEEAKRVKKVITIWKEPGEPADEVIERHLETHPEHQGPGYNLLVIGWMAQP